MENGPGEEKDQRHPESGRDETEEERLDRNLGEMLQELRVALPGVQVLFAFLLAVPFQQGFEKITSFQKGAYFGTLVCTAISAVMLISPTATTGSPSATNRSGSSSSTPIASRSSASSSSPWR